jgi:hypothetical protein
MNEGKLGSRSNYLLQTLAGNAHDRFTLKPFSASEAKELILKMDGHGLTSSKPDKLAEQSAEIAKDPIAIGVCRIMNNFKPVEDIIRSLILDADTDRISRYIGCALASYCYRAGIAYPILSAAFNAIGLQQQLSNRDMLPLSFSDLDTKEYVIPTNPLLAQRVLREVSDNDPDLMFEVYCAIGAHLAPYVNRSAVQKRTPEARLSGRLFDYDDVVSEFISSKSEAFYLAMKKFWDWNSRYWEQFALLKLDKFINSNQPDRFDQLSQAISHAKHAIQLERHPLGLTTLGRILLEEMKQVPSRFQKSFRRGFRISRRGNQARGKNESHCDSSVHDDV